MWRRMHTTVALGVSKKRIWELWTDVNNWPNWHGDLEFCLMKGAFCEGAHFILKPKGVRPVTIYITKIEQGTSFTDCTCFFGAKMYDTHKMEDTPQGLKLTNELVVTGVLKWLWIYLVARNVASGVPNEVEALLKLARNK